MRKTAYTLTLSALIGLSQPFSLYAQNTTPQSALLTSMQEQLDEMKSKIALVKFQDTQDAIRLTRQALEFLTQAKFGANALANDGGDQKDQYLETRALLSEMQEELFLQLSALDTGDETKFRAARIEFNQLYAKISKEIR